MLPVHLRCDPVALAEVDVVPRPGKPVPVAQPEGLVLLEQHVEGVVLGLGQVGVAVVDSRDRHVQPFPGQPETAQDAPLRPPACDVPVSAWGDVQPVSVEVEDPCRGADLDGIASLTDTVCRNRRQLPAAIVSGTHTHKAAVEVFRSVGHDVHHTRIGVGAVNGRAGSLDDLDLLHVDQRQVGVNPGVGIDSVVPGNAVDQQKELVVVGAHHPRNQSEPAAPRATP